MVVPCALVLAFGHGLLFRFLLNAADEADEADEAEGRFARDMVCPAMTVRSAKIHPGLGDWVSASCCFMPEPKTVYGSSHPGIAIPGSRSHVSDGGKDGDMINFTPDKFNVVAPSSISVPPIQNRKSG